MTIFRCFVLMAALFALFQQAPVRKASPAGGFENFTFTLSTPKTKYVELQPIPLVITLKNETQQTLIGHSGLMFAAPYIRLYIDRGDGSEEVGQSMMSRDVIASPREFKPGEEVREIERLYYKLNEVFPNPGIYKLHAQLCSHDGSQTVTSKPIEVEIVKAEGPDAEALEFIRTHDKPAYFFTGYNLVRNPEKLKAFEDFVARFRETVYGDDALLLLGQVRFALRDYAAARTIFEALEKKSDYPFAHEATEYLKYVTQREYQEELRKARP